MDSQKEAFIQILSSRTMLKLYILSIVHDPHLAEDTLSDVTVVIAQSWDQYDKEKPFGPWARGIARRVALANLRKKNRAVVVLDEDVLEAFGADLEAAGDETQLDEMKQLLAQCVRKLSDKKRKLIAMRYFEYRSYNDISTLTGQTVKALYMALSRIHKMLADCVKGLL